MAIISREYQYVAKAVGKHLQIPPREFRRRKGAARASYRLADGRAMICVALGTVGYSLTEIAGPLNLNHTTVLRYQRRGISTDKHAFVEHLMAGRPHVVRASPVANFGGFNEVLPAGPDLRVQWERAVTGYWKRGEEDRPKYWRNTMRRVFPYSGWKQAAMPPREQAYAA